MRFWLIFLFSLKKTILVVDGVTYPIKISQVLTKMTQLTQKALQSRLSRIEIELPPNADFGLEKNSHSASNPDISRLELVNKANRESARLFTDMFSSISSTTVVLFPTESEASFARNLWGALFRGKVLSIDVPLTAAGATNLRSRRFTFEQQQQALLSSGNERDIYVPEGTDVLIIAGPRQKDISKIQRLSAKLTDSTLIVLLNSRAAAHSKSLAAEASAQDSKGNNADKTRGGGFQASFDEKANKQIGFNQQRGSFLDWVNEHYVPVFHYAPPVIDESVIPHGQSFDERNRKELLLYHELNGLWYLAVKEVPSQMSEKERGLGTLAEGLVDAITRTGRFKTVWEGNHRPASMEIMKIIRTLST
jgi:hypothetical protein